jgi:hypothetical protein
MRSVKGEPGNYRTSISNHKDALPQAELTLRKYPIPTFQQLLRNKY